MSLNNYKDLEEEELFPEYANIHDFLFDEPELTNFKWYLLIKSSDLFVEKYLRYPGEGIPHEDFENDIILFKEIYLEYLNKNNRRRKLEEINFDWEIEDKYFHEVCRNSNSVVVPATSMLGSMAAQ